jgi:hypothetical protein
MFRKFENMRKMNDLDSNTREERSIQQMKKKVERLKNLLSKKQAPVVKKKKKKFRKKSGKQSILKKKKGEPRTSPFYQLKNGSSTKKMNQLVVPSKIKNPLSISREKENFGYEDESQLMKSSKKQLNVQEIRLEIEEGNGNHLTRRDLLLMNQELIKQLRNEGEEKYGTKVEELENKIKLLEAEKDQKEKKRIQIENQLFGNNDFIQRLGKLNEELKLQIQMKDERIQKLSLENETNKCKVEEQKQENLMMSKKLESLEVIVTELEARRDKLRKTLKRGVEKDEDVWDKNFDLEESNLVLKRENKVLLDENLKIRFDLDKCEKLLRSKMKEIEKERSQKEIIELKLVS